MTKTKILAAAAILTSLMTVPALAQDTQRPAIMHSHHYNHAYRHAHNGGFWPADAAAGIVGGAIGAAGAIASAPFQGDAYAYDDSNGWDNGYNGGWNGQTYAERNGFVCQPGTWFRGEDGRRHICQ